MSTIPRTPKSTGQWDQTDLSAYNIELKSEDPLTFFDVDTLPAPQLSNPVLLTAEDWHKPDTVSIQTLLDGANSQLMEDSSAIRGCHTYILIFVMNLLHYHFKGYIPENNGRVPMYFRLFRYRICGERRQATLRGSIMDLDVSNEEVLLIIDDGGLGTVRKPDGKLKRWRGDRSATMVANAIAAFDVNNDGREKKDGQEPLDERIMPGIIMTGTVPTFFKVPVTKELARHVNEGTYPPFVTTVTFCQPPLKHGGVNGEYGGGMKPLDDRITILSCFEAFQKFVGD